MTGMIRHATAGAVAIALAGAASAAAAAELRFNGWLPPFHPINKMTMIPWTKEVEKATEGRVKVVFTPQSVVPPPRQLDAVRSGAVDFAFNVHGFTPGQFKAGRIAELPFLARDAEPLSVAFWRTHETHLDKAKEYQGVKLITVFAGAPGMLWSHTKPFREMSDWQGAKIFCGVKNTCTLAQLLGGVPVQRPGPQVTQMIERKIVDVVFIDPASYKNFRLHRFIKYAMFAPRGYYAPTFYLVMNKKSWDALSETDQAAIDKLSGEALARKAGADWDTDAAASKALMKENNVEVIMASGAYLEALEKRLVPPLEAEYLKEAKAAGIDGAAALAYLRAQLAELTKK